MPVWLQVWIVIATGGMLALGVLTALTITRNVRNLTKEIVELTDKLEASASQVRVAMEDSRHLVASAQEVVASIRPAVKRWADVGERTASASSALLDVIEPPLYSTASVSQGVRAATSHFARRLLHRFLSGSSSSRERNGHE